MRLRIGIVLSVCYLALVVALPIVMGWGSKGFSWDVLGQWLTGALAPLALGWAIIGFVIQFRQLALNQKGLVEQGKKLADQLAEMRETRKVFEKQIEEQTRLVQETVRSNELRWRAHLRAIIPDQVAYLDDRAKKIAQKHGTYSSDKKGIAGLLNYLNSLDYMHGTPDQQARIQELENEDDFKRFCRDFYSFEGLLSDDLRFLVPLDFEFDKLRSALDRFWGYSRIISVVYPT